MIEAVLFDYGLTLVDFEYPRACLLEMLERVRPWLGPSAPLPDQLMASVLEPLEEDIQAAEGSMDELPFWPLYEKAWRRAGLNPARQVLGRILDQEQACWDRAVRVVPGGRELLQALRERGLGTGLCSNAIFPGDLMRRQLAVNGLDRLLDATVFSTDVGRRKPAPEIYLAALRALGTRPQTTLFVGDNVAWDYEAPTRLGMQAVISTQLRPALAVPDGVPVISRLDQLEALL